jgi:hypothetical protein
MNSRRNDVAGTSVGARIAPEAWEQVSAQPRMRPMQISDGSLPGLAHQSRCHRTDITLASRPSDATASEPFRGNAAAA